MEFCSSADVKWVPLGNQANFMPSYLDLWGAPLSHQVLEFGQDEAGNTPGFPVELESEDQLLHNHLRVGGWTVKTKDIEWYKPTNRKSQTVQLISPLDGTQKLPLPYSRSTRVIFFLFISDNSVTWYDMSIPQADSHRTQREICGFHHWEGASTLSVKSGYNEDAFHFILATALQH